MRTLLAAVVMVPLLYGCGGSTCKDACKKMSSCLGYANEAGASSTWECPLTVGSCDAQKKCFARCNLDATCDDIKNPKPGSDYADCKDKCATQYFKDTGGTVPVDSWPADSSTSPDGDATTDADSQT